MSSWGIGADFGKVAAVAAVERTDAGEEWLRYTWAQEFVGDWGIAQARVVAELVAARIMDSLDVTRRIARGHSEPIRARRLVVPVILEEPWLRPVRGRRRTDPKPILAHAVGLGVIVGHLEAWNLDGEAAFRPVLEPVLESPAMMEIATDLAKERRMRELPLIVRSEDWDGCLFGPGADPWKRWRGDRGGPGRAPHLADAVFLARWGATRYREGVRVL